MSNSINTNIAAFYAQQNITTASNAATSNVARLSSGNAIVNASDNVSALAIGTSIGTQVSILQTAQTNAAQGTSLLQVADGALSQIQSILQQQQSIANQAQSGTLTDTDRGFLNQEFQTLTNEINALASGTTFNGVQLINGAISGGTAINTNTTAGSTNLSVTATLATLGTNVTSGNTFSITVAGQPAESFTFGIAAGDVGIGATAADSTANLAAALNNSGLSQLADFRFQSNGTTLSAYYTGKTTGINNIPALTIGSTGTAITPTATPSFSAATQIGTISGAVASGDTFTIGSHTITFDSNGTNTAGYVSTTLGNGNVDIGTTALTNGVTGTALTNLAAFLNSVAGTAGWSDLAGITFSTDATGVPTHLNAAYSGGGSTQPTLSTSYTSNSSNNFSGGTAQNVEASTSLITLDNNALTAGASTITVGNGVSNITIKVGTAAQAAAATASLNTTSATIDGSGSLSNTLTNIVSYLNGATANALFPTGLAGAKFSTNGTQLFVTNPATTPTTGISATLVNGATNADNVYTTTATGGTVTGTTVNANSVVALQGLTADTFGSSATLTIAGVGFTFGASTSGTQINDSVSTQLQLAAIAAYLNSSAGQTATGLPSTVAWSVSATTQADGFNLVATNNAPTSVNLSATTLGGTVPTGAFAQGLTSAAALNGTSSLVNIVGGGSTIANGTVFNIGGQAITVVPSGAGVGQINNGTNQQVLANLASYLNQGGVNAKLSGGLAGITFSSDATNLYTLNTTVSAADEASSGTGLGAAVTGVNTAQTSGTPAGGGIPSGSTVTANPIDSQAVNVFNVTSGHFDASTTLSIAGINFTFSSVTTANNTGASNVIQISTANLNSTTGDTQALQGIAKYLDANQGLLAAGAQGTTFTYSTNAGATGTKGLVAANPTGTATTVATNLTAAGGSSLVGGSDAGALTVGTALTNNVAQNAGTPASVFALTSGNFSTTSAVAATTLTLGGVNFTFVSGTATNNTGASSVIQIDAGDLTSGTVNTAAGNIEALQGIVKYLNTQGSVAGVTFAFDANANGANKPGIVATTSSASTVANVGVNLTVAGTGVVAASDSNGTLTAATADTVAIAPNNNPAKNAFSITSGDFAVTTNLTIAGVNFTIASGTASNNTGASTTIQVDAGNLTSGTSNAAGDAQILQGIVKYLNTNSIVPGATFTYSTNADGATHKGIIVNNTSTTTPASLTVNLAVAGGGTLVGKANGGALTAGTPSTFSLPVNSSSLLSLTGTTTSSTVNSGTVLNLLGSTASTYSAAITFVPSTATPNTTVGQVKLGATDSATLTNLASYLNSTAGQAYIANTAYAGLTFVTDGTNLFVGNSTGAAITPTTTFNASNPSDVTVATNVTLAAPSIAGSFTGTAPISSGGLFTIGSNAVNGTNITSSTQFAIGGNTVTFGNALAVAAGTAKVLIGTSNADTLANLATYLNGTAVNAALTGKYAGLTFSSNAANLIATNNTSSSVTTTSATSFAAGTPVGGSGQSTGTLAATGGAENVLTISASPQFSSYTNVSIGGQTVTFGTAAQVTAATADVAIGSNNLATLNNLVSYLNTNKALFTTGGFNNVTYTTDGTNLVATAGVSGASLTAADITFSAGTPAGATSLTANATLTAGQTSNVLTLGVDTLVFGTAAQVTAGTANVNAGSTLANSLTNAVAYLNGSAPNGTNTVYTTNGTQLLAQTTGSTPQTLTSIFNSTDPVFAGVTGQIITASGVVGLGAGITSAQGTPTGSLLVQDTGITATNFGNGVDLSQVANNADFVGAFGGSGSIGAITANYVNTGLTSTSGVQFSVVVGNDTYTTSTIQNSVLNGTAPVPLLFSGSNTTTSAAEGGSFTLTLQPQANVTSQNGASQLATGINAALSTVSAYQNRNVLSYNNNFSAEVSNQQTATLAGSSLAFNSNDFSSPVISSVSVSAPSTGSTDAKITAVINGDTYTTTSGIGDTFTANNEIVLENQSNPDQTLTLTLGANGSANLSNASNAAAFQTALSSALGISTAAGGLTFQLGSTAAANVNVTIASATSSALFNGATLDVSTAVTAATASTAVTVALNAITAGRSQVGAFETQFNFAAAALQSSVQNETAAQSSLLDTNIATESTAFATNQVKLQAGISVLAQANQQTQALLKLIS